MLVIKKCAKQTTIKEAKTNSHVEIGKLNSCEKLENILKDKASDILATRLRHQKNVLRRIVFSVNTQKLYFQMNPAAFEAKLTCVHSHENRVYLFSVLSI